MKLQRVRKTHAILAFVGAVALTVGLAARAGGAPPSGAAGGAPPSRAAAAARPDACPTPCDNGKVAICHRDGLAGTIREQTLCLPAGASQNHVDQGGSQAGHELDVCGVCPSDQ